MNATSSKLLIACCLGVFGMAIAVPAKEPKNSSLAIELSFSKPRFPVARDSLDAETGFGETNQILCYVQLTNNGLEKIRVPTGPLKNIVVRTTLATSGKWEHVLILDWYMIRRNGKNIDVPAESDLRIVELHAGEATVIRIGIYGYSEGESDFTEYSLQYNVDRAFAERFDIWSGELMSGSR